MALSPDLIVRPYNEIVDDVLVAMLGGVVNEQLIFDVREASYPLAQPARDVRGVTGTADVTGKGDDQHYTFQPNVDWTFDRAQNAVVWLDKGQKPSPHDPVFYVDYFPVSGGDSPLTDINIGSVNRTLAEAMSRELAILYRQVNLAYQSGFIDLAQGKSLDFVVAILGIQRKTGDFAQGLVTFFRTITSRGNITIPQGTKLTTADGVVFETISERTLQRGQVRIDVPVRAAGGFKGPAGRVDAHTITSLIIPIEGIDRVTNFDPTVLGGADESDEDLRARAKAVLRGLGQCTVDALLLAAREAGAPNVEIMDPQFPPDDPAKHTAPGKVVMIVEVEPARYDNVVGAVNEHRAAGINVQFVARYVFIHPRMSIQLRRDLTAAGKDQLKQDVIKALSDFVAGLGSGNAVPGQGMFNAVKTVADVQDAKIVDLLVWETVVEEGAQLGQRRAARELIVGPDGSTQATDDDIEAGKFQVKVETQWWPVLEMEPADIQLTGP
jgi:hypothetical protein